MSFVFLNSTLLPAAEARIPIDDRGFRFGDGVFETIPVYNGAPYLLHYHLQRLQAGLSALQIAYDSVGLPASIHEVLSANNTNEGVLRLYITRGSGSQGYLPALVATAPTVLIQVLPMPELPQAPIMLWLSPWEKISPKALPVSHKIAQGINATLARMEARDHQCYDALQQSAQGHICEASSANIFWIRNDQLFTPSLATGALAGVTRRRVMELAGGATEGEFTLATLQAADGVFLTNSTNGIVPVAGLNPAGYTWESARFSERFASLRRKDIAESA